MHYRNTKTGADIYVNSEISAPNYVRIDDGAGTPPPKKDPVIEEPKKEEPKKPEAINKPAQKKTTPKKTTKRAKK